jgi:hypothetical protein
MQLPVSANQQVPPAIKWLDISLLVLLAALIFFLVATTANDLFPGDLGSWVGDSLKLGQCLGDQAQACGAISKFPLAYTLNSGLLIQVIRHAIKLPAFLAALNAITLALPLLLLRLACSNRELFQGWALYVALWLLTPIPRFYLFTGSLEVQAGAITGLAFVLTFRALVTRNGEPKADRWPSLSTILLCNGLWFIACLYKDTSVITFAGAALLLLFSDQAWRKLGSKSLWRRKPGDREDGMKAKQSFKAHWLVNDQFRALWLTMPALIAAALAQASFNLIRYRSFLPESYLNEARLTTTPIFFRLQSLFWTLASPNGGLVVFWGLCFAVLGLVWIRQSRCDRFQFAAVKAAALWSLISLIGLSLWWNPFGWASWGDRLMVPAVMATVIAFWEALSSPRRLQPMPVQGAKGEAQFLRPPGSNERKLWSKPALLASYLLVVILIMSSFPYVSLGYQGNGMDVRHHPAPELIHCAKMMARLQAVPEERHLQDVYSGELWWQCALESYRHNPVLAW